MVLTASNVLDESHEQHIGHSQKSLRMHGIPSKCLVVSKSPKSDFETVKLDGLPGAAINGAPVQVTIIAVSIPFLRPVDEFLVSLLL